MKSGADLWTLKRNLKTHLFNLSELAATSAFEWFIPYTMRLIDFMLFLKVDSYNFFFSFHAQHTVRSLGDDDNINVNK